MIDELLFEPVNGVDDERLEVMGFGGEFCRRGNDVFPRFERGQRATSRW